MLGASAAASFKLRPRRRSQQAGEDVLGSLDVLSHQLYGAKALTVADQRLTCSRWRITGGVEVELWFDSQGLLVRQVGMEDGHHTELRLVSIQQPMAALATRLP